LLLLFLSVGCRSSCVIIQQQQQQQQQLLACVTGVLT